MKRWQNKPQNKWQDKLYAYFTPVPTLTELTSETFLHGLIEDLLAKTFEINSIPCGEFVDEQTMKDRLVAEARLSRLFMLAGFDEFPELHKVQKIIIDKSLAIMKADLKKKTASGHHLGLMLISNIGTWRNLKRAKKFTALAEKLKFYNDSFFKDRYVLWKKLETKDLSRYVRSRMLTKKTRC